MKKINLKQNEEIQISFSSSKKTNTRKYKAKMIFAEFKFGTSSADKGKIDVIFEVL